jgi:3-deoxy-D-manno-octulosonate 8-phosphate phosphatase (KDO 8-P phosphatase)
MCRAFGIEVVVVTGENTEIVKRRCEKLKIDKYFMGVSDKLLVIEAYLKSKNISWSEVAYIGDDINDIKLMQMVGIKGTPNNGIKFIKQMADIVTEKNGGEGAFREFVEKILLSNYSYTEILSKLGSL